MYNRVAYTEFHVETQEERLNQREKASAGNVNSKDIVVPAINNLGEFIIHEENHTLGNLLRVHLCRHPNIGKVSYTQPYPEQHSIIVNVFLNDTEATFPTTTAPLPKRTIRPIDAVKQSVQGIIREVGSIQDEFQRSVDDFILKQRPGFPPSTSSPSKDENDNDMDTEE